MILNLPASLWIYLPIPATVSVRRAFPPARVFVVPGSIHPFFPPFPVLLLPHKSNREKKMENRPSHLKARFGPVKLETENRG